MPNVHKEITDAKLMLAEMVDDRGTEETRYILKGMSLISGDASRVMLALLEDKDLENFGLLNYQDAKAKRSLLEELKDNIEEISTQELYSKLGKGVDISVLTDNDLFWVGVYNGDFDDLFLQYPEINFQSGTGAIYNLSKEKEFVSRRKSCQIRSKFLLRIGDEKKLYKVALQE